MDTDFLTITLTWLPFIFSCVLLVFSLILVSEENTHPLFLPACFYIGVWSVFIFVAMIWLLVMIFESGYKRAMAVEYIVN
jgi:hypothetical protein